MMMMARLLFRYCILFFWKLGNCYQYYQRKQKIEKMKRMLGLDQSYEELKEIGLLGGEFGGLSYSLIKKYIQTLMFVRLNREQLKEIFSMLNSENKDSKSTLKIFIMLNISIHEAVNQGKRQFDDLIVEEINFLINQENSRYERVQRRRNKQKEKGFSLEKTVGWIKSGIRDTFSKSKDKPEKANSSLNNTRLRSRAGTQTTQNLDTPIARSERIDSQAEVKGKQQLLICDLVIPYATYLLKLASSQINLQKEFALPNLKTEHLWKIVNLLNYLLKVSAAFNTIMRYYKVDYEQLVEGTIRSMDNEIKLLYPLLDKSITKKFELFRKETLEIYREQGNSRSKTQKLEQMIFKYEVKELKQILQEIGCLNEEIQKVYLGKYIYYKVRAMGITQPNLISDTSFDLIYDVIKEVEKSKSQSKRQSSSKEKKPQIIVTHLKQEPVNPLKSAFTQKKLKIVSSEDKKIIPKNSSLLNQTAPVIAQNQSTFRRMRMNMTSTNISLEQSNTRRLRL